MNKAEFKKNYHLYRKAMFNFEVKMQNGNYPCGHDDMLAERFSDQCQEFLKDKPEIDETYENRYALDYLERKQREKNDGHWSYSWLLKDNIKSHIDYLRNENA